MSIPISLSYYSEIERGLRKIPEDLLAKLYSKLNLPYLSEDWYLIYSKKIELLKTYLYYCKHDDILTIYKELEEECKNLNNSLLFLDYQLVVFMYNSSISHIMDKKQIKLINEYTNYLSDEQKYIYELYRGILEKYQHHPEKAFIIFKNLLDSNAKFRYYTEILYYHSAICFIQKGFLVLAQNLNKEAEILFLKEGNMNRLAYTMMHEAIIYTQENHFSEADTIYDRLLITCKGLSSRTMNTILCNAGLNCIKAKDYSKAISIYKQLKPGWQCLNGLHYGIALTLLLSNENEKLNEFLEYSKKYHKNKFIKDMLDIIYLQNKPNQEKAIELKLKSCEKYLTREGSRESMIFVYEQLIQYYETRSIVKQVKYLKKLNELNKRGMQYEQ